MLSQLVYVSVRNPNCTDAEIEKILASCNKNNPLIDITGVLLYSTTNFIQMIEGEYKLIMGLYDKIKLDNRHGNIRLISVGPIKEKAFPSWHMGTKKLTDNTIDFKTAITS
ncbi:MAG: BLUF domain-containing protein, partial [Cytophagales bacterium]|nr:BLUF domain-containing protein [Cytophagales bacterium]